MSNSGYSEIVVIVVRHSSPQFGQFVFWAGTSYALISADVFTDTPEWRLLSDCRPHGSDLDAGLPRLVMGKLEVCVCALLRNSIEHEIFVLYIRRTAAEKNGAGGGNRTGACQEPL